MYLMCEKPVMVMLKDSNFGNYRQNFINFDESFPKLSILSPRITSIPGLIPEENKA